ncbi:hypothetical protein VLK31_28110 [Variovorax sp. H27-G14]|uniref:hypothetical protein n=1 Tax=Variovorax sp. H27-G14 TaxID=3111914 RepID=UPI0038FC3078
MSLPPDMQMRLVNLTTDLLQLQRAVQELLQHCASTQNNADPDDFIGTAQYLALEAALHSPDPAQPRSRSGRKRAPNC